jgi:AraC-like DNA-binding protein
VVVELAAGRRDDRNPKGAQFGLPAHAYLSSLRVAHAKRMIRAGTPPAEVAYAVGYCDQSHLNRRFKKIVGVTPSQYAQRSGP